MAEKKMDKIEREYVIPLREKIRPVPRYKRTPKAVKTVKEFLARHMAIRDRDLNKIKLDTYLNEALWHRGIKNPIHKVKVRAVKEGDIVRAYAVDLPTNLEFKKKREEKISSDQKKVAEEVKKARVKAEKEAEESTDLDNDGVNDKVEEKEKAEAVEELAQKEMKAEANANKTTPKKGKEKLAEKKTVNKQSQGQ